VIDRTGVECWQHMRLGAACRDLINLNPSKLGDKVDEGHRHRWSILAATRADNEGGG